MKKFFVLFLLFFLFGCTAKNQTYIPFVRVEKISKANFSKTKVFYGYVDKKDKVNLSFSKSGPLGKILVSEGQVVKKGTLLAQIDNEEFNLNLKKTNLQLEEAKIKYNRAKNYFERISKLYDAGGISHNDWENAQTELFITQNNVEILKDSVLISKENERFSKIFAPYDGQIIRIFKDDYQFVNGGDTVFSFQGIGDFLVRVFVSQNDIDKIKIGDSVEIVSDINNKKFKGFVESKVDSSLNSGAFRVTISILDSKNFLTGESVKVYFDTVVNNSITVPIDSLIVEDDKKFVYLLYPFEKNLGKVKKKEVIIGDVLNNRFEIISGVLPEDVLVVGGVDKIMDNSVVRFGD